MTLLEDASRAARYRRQQQKRRKSIQKIQHSTSIASPEMIVALSLALMVAIAVFAAFLHAKLHAADAFAPNRLPTRVKTQIYLEDWVADMIDRELYRQEHHKEYEAEWMEKNRGAVVSSLSDSNVGAYPSQMMEDRAAFAEHRRDERMAFLKPDKYCADRCLATGNCDIMEDFYEMTPEDVLKFCEECILGDDEINECNVPDAFYEKEPPLRP